MGRTPWSAFVRMCPKQGHKLVISPRSILESILRWLISPFCSFSSKKEGSRARVCRTALDHRAKSDRQILSKRESSTLQVQVFWYHHFYHSFQPPQTTTTLFIGLHVPVYKPSPTIRSNAFILNSIFNHKSSTNFVTQNIRSLIKLLSRWKHSEIKLNTDIDIQKAVPEIWNQNVHRFR